VSVGKPLFEQIMEFVPMDDLHAHRASLWRQLGRAHVVVRRAVACDGLRATDLTRKLARYRIESGGQREQAVCDGLSLTRQTLHAGRCQRVARLAHLVGPGRRSDSPGPQTLRERTAGRWRVCMRCIRPEPSSSRGPSRRWTRGACTRPPQSETPGSFAISA